MWNYRVFKAEVSGETYYDIHEVYYTDGKICQWTDRAMAPVGESLADIQNDLEMMLKALDEPVLDANNPKGVEYE
jgi:hypothetical protein